MRWSSCYVLYWCLISFTFESSSGMYHLQVINACSLLNPLYVSSVFSLCTFCATPYRNHQLISSKIFPVERRHRFLLFFACLDLHWMTCGASVCHSLRIMNLSTHCMSGFVETNWFNSVLKFLTSAVCCHESSNVISFTPLTFILQQDVLFHVYSPFLLLILIKCLHRMCDDTAEGGKDRHSLHGHWQGNWFNWLVFFL